MVLHATAVLCVCREVEGGEGREGGEMDSREWSEGLRIRYWGGAVEAILIGSLASQPLPSALLLFRNSRNAEGRGWRTRLIDR